MGQCAEAWADMMSSRQDTTCPRCGHDETDRNPDNLDFAFHRDHCEEGHPVSDGARDFIDGVDEHFWQQHTTETTMDKQDVILLALERLTKAVQILAEQSAAKARKKPSTQKRGRTANPGIHASRAEALLLVLAASPAGRSVVAKHMSQQYGASIATWRVVADRLFKSGRIVKAIRDGKVVLVPAGEQ